VYSVSSAVRAGGAGDAAAFSRKFFWANLANLGENWAKFGQK